LRYDAAGNPDPSFGILGRVSGDGSTIAIQADGKILAAGPTLQRFNSDGSLDKAFGMGGQVPISANNLAVGPDGEIFVSVVSADSGSSSSLIQYKPNGNRELRFGSSGQVTVDFFAGTANALAVQPDGKIVLAGGLAMAGRSQSPTVGRYLPAEPSAASNQFFVQQLYLDLLQRPGEPAGVAGWTAALDQGVSRVQIVQAFQSSPEYHLLIVKHLYQQVLGRGVDASGQTSWVNFLNQGGTAAQLEAMLLGSDEFFASHGKDNTSGFLPALYQVIVQRPIDPTGAQGWGQALQSGAWSRQAVAAAILASEEADALVIHTDYLRLLHRVADPDGFANSLNALQRGLTEEQLLALLAGSAEYFAQL
jgi:uncharacterized delta-60 repeat protein